MDLTQRLILIRAFVLQRCKIEENTLINQVFNIPMFKQFLAMADTAHENQIESNDDYIALLSMELSGDRAMMVEKYGHYFIAEYKHFIYIVRLTQQITGSYFYQDLIEEEEYEHKKTPDGTKLLIEEEEPAPVSNKENNDIVDIRSFFNKSKTQSGINSCEKVDGAEVDG